MTDIFHEIQDDLRRDRMKALWDRYGTVVVLVAALIVAVVGGWRGYEYWKASEAADAGDRYIAASRLSAEGKVEEAKAAFAALAADAPGGYETLSRLREADEVARGDKAAALKLYMAIVNDGSADEMLRNAARIRGAYTAVDGGSRDDVRKLAEPLAAPGGQWTPLAREALGLAAFKAGDFEDARRQFDAVVSDPDAPGGARQRADLMLSVLPAAPPPAQKPAGDAAKPAN